MGVAWVIEKKTLQADPDGLLTYEYIANHIGQPEMDLPWLVDNKQCSEQDHVVGLRVAHLHGSIGGVDGQTAYVGACGLPVYAVRVRQRSH